MSRLRRAFRNHLHFIVIVWVLIAVMTWPTIVHVFDTTVFWLPADDGDAWIEFWNAWYGKLILAGEAEFYFTDLSFYPHGVSLAYHILSIPHMLIFGGLQAIMPASNAFNLTYLLIIFSTASSAYVYLLYLLKDKWVSLFGAVIFGLSGYIVGRPPHPGVTFLATLPLALYFFHRAILEKRRRFIGISGVLIGLTAFIGPYMYVCLLLTLGLYILYFARSRWRNPHFWMRIALLFFIIGAVSIARIYPMLADSQSLDDALNKSGGAENDLLQYFINYEHPIVSEFIATGIVQLANPGWRWNTSYLGYVPLILIGFGVFRAVHRRKMLPWLLLILPFLTLRLGSVLKINTREFPGILLPKHYLDEIFPVIFEGFYTPDHFQAGVLLPLAILSCYGLMTLLKPVPTQRRMRIILICIALVAFEYYRLPEERIVTDREIAFLDWLRLEEDQDSIRLINLPRGRLNSKQYLFYQTLSGYPQVEGLATRTPPDAYTYIKNNLLLNAWHSTRGIQCTLSNQTEYLSALDDLADDGFSHILHHLRIEGGIAVADSFRGAEPSYKNRFVAGYRLEDMRNSCPGFVSGHDLVAHYQNLFFSPVIVPRPETVLSFHPTERITEDAFHYYSRLSWQWKGLIHISHNEQNEIMIQSSQPKFSDLDGIVSGNDSILLIYNPRQTHLQTMDAYTEWFSQYYKPCKRFLENDNTIIDAYYRVSIPCELIDTQSPFAVLYDNGILLSNRLYEMDSDQMTFSFWWGSEVEHDYAFSIQIFNEQGEKVQQYDDSIAREPSFAFYDVDISMLTEDDYAAKLIVYDFVTHVSQPGTVLSNQGRFERELEIARFMIHD